MSPVNTTYCPAVANFEHWSRLDWSKGLQVHDLDALETLEVRTKNTTYEITVRTRAEARFWCAADSFFPCIRACDCLGASLAGSFLKVGGIYVGFCMEFHTEGGPIVTTRVRQIAVARNTAPPS